MAKNWPILLKSHSKSQILFVFFQGAKTSISKLGKREFSLTDIVEKRPIPWKAILKVRFHSRLFRVPNGPFPSWEEQNFRQQVRWHGWKMGQFLWKATPKVRFYLCFSGVLNDQISNLGRTEVLWNFVNRSGDMAEIMANFFGKQFQMSDFIRVFSVY